MNNIFSNIELSFVFKTFFYYERMRSNPFVNPCEYTSYFEVFIETKHLLYVCVYNFHDYFELVFLNLN